MKDADIKYIEIVPSETILDFMGQARLSPPSSSDSEHKEPDSITLKGEVLFALNRSLKIRGMTVKFKGVVNTNYNSSTLEAPVLPKLKQSLFSRTTVLPAGDHAIPFLLEIPNIYPQSLSIKRASISYKIEVSIAIGLQKKSVTAEHEILVRRHLLRCKEMAPLVETQILEHTLPAKFHYEIDAPQIVCLEQGHIPVSVKYLCFATQKAVRNIRTQLKQIELYSPAGSGGVRKIQTIADNLMMANRPHLKYIKRTVPALLHSIDNSQEKSTWKRPLVLRHSLQKLITPTLQSPLLSVYHELEITFQFEHKFDSIKAKIPLVIASVPPQERIPMFQFTNTMPQYHFEVDKTRLHDSFISVRVEGPTRVKEVDPVDDGESYQPNVHYSILGEPQLKMEARVQNSGSLSRSIRKFSSANELVRLAQEHEQLLQGDRPSTATPIAQRRRIGRDMQPIDVELANGLKKPTNKMSMVDYMKNKALLKQAHRQSTPPIVMATKQTEIQYQRLQNQQQQQQMHSSTLDYLIMDDAISLRSESTSQTTRSSSPDSFEDGELRSRPPSMVFNTAPGLPVETVLRPTAAVERSLVEEMFMHDMGSADLSPHATIASSSILSRNSSMAMVRKSRASIPLSAAINYMRDSSSLSSESDIFILRQVQSGSIHHPAHFPSQGPPPRSPLPPVPSIPLPHAQSAILTAPISSCTTAIGTTPPVVSPPHQLTGTTENPYVYLELPPLPSKTVGTKVTPTVEPKRDLGDSSGDEDVEDDFVQNTTRRMTKLYVEDSDDEVLDPLPPIPEKHRHRFSPAVDTSAVPMLPRLSFGTTFDISFD